MDLFKRTFFIDVVFTLIEIVPLLVFCRNTGRSFNAELLFKQYVDLSRIISERFPLFHCILMKVEELKNEYR